MSDRGEGPTSDRGEGPTLDRGRGPHRNEGEVHIGSREGSTSDRGRGPHWIEGWSIVIAGYSQMSRQLHRRMFKNVSRRACGYF